MWTPGPGGPGMGAASQSYVMHRTFTQWSHHNVLLHSGLNCSLAAIAAFQNIEIKLR